MNEGLVCKGNNIEKILLDSTSKDGRFGEYRNEIIKPRFELLSRYLFMFKLWLHNEKNVK